MATFVELLLYVWVATLIGLFVSMAQNGNILGFLVALAIEGAVMFVAHVSHLRLDHSVFMRKTIVAYKREK